jgi:hypothetical protein
LRLIRGVDRMDHADSKFVQPGATPGLPANFSPVVGYRYSVLVKDYSKVIEGEFHDPNIW